MSEERIPLTHRDQLAGLDDAEIGEGYLDGLRGDAEPGDNRSLAYWHGWRNGSNDRSGKVDAAQTALAKSLYTPPLLTERFPE